MDDIQGIKDSYIRKRVLEAEALYPFFKAKYIVGGSVVVKAFGNYYYPIGFLNFRGKLTEKDSDYYFAKRAFQTKPKPNL